MLSKTSSNKPKSKIFIFQAAFIVDLINIYCRMNIHIWAVLSDEQMSNG